MGHRPVLCLQGQLLRAAILQADPRRHAWVPGQSPPEVSSTLWEGEGRTSKQALLSFLALTPVQDSRDQFPSTGYLQASQGNNPSMAMERIR